MGPYFGDDFQQVIEIYDLQDMSVDGILRNEASTDKSPRVCPFTATWRFLPVIYLENRCNRLPAQPNPSNLGSSLLFYTQSEAPAMSRLITGKGMVGAWSVLSGLAEKDNCLIRALYFATGTL